MTADVAGGDGGLPNEGEVIRDPFGRDHHDPRTQGLPQVGEVLAPGYARGHHLPSRILILIDAGVSG
jgi:hypothetical protein